MNDFPLNWRNLCLKSNVNILLFKPGKIMWILIQAEQIILKA